MKNFLNNIRSSNNIKLKNKIINSASIFVIGIVLGVFAKWLDNLSINDSIWLQQIIGRLDLGNILSDLGIWLCIALVISIYSKSPFRAALNVFLFFVGMTISYHLYTIIFSGFNPKEYMMRWYGLTILSPFLAFICWYSKGEKIFSIIISSLIIGVMFKICFSIGYIYFDFKSIIDTLIFITSFIVLYTKPKNILISLFFGIIIAFILCNFNIFVF